MPDIGKFWVKSSQFAHHDTMLHIFSYLFYPNNQEKRNAYIAYWAGYERDILRDASRERVIADLRAWHGNEKPLPLELTPEEYFAQCKRQLMDRSTRYQDKFGGSTSLLHLPHGEDKWQKEIDKAFYDAMRVGVLFRLLVDLSRYYGRNISMEKVFPVFIEHPVFALLRLQEGRPKQYTPKMLRDMWENHRKSAHFCAALCWFGVHNNRDYFKWSLAGVEPFSPDHRRIICAQLMLNVHWLEHIASLGNYLAFLQRDETLQRRLAKKKDIFAFLRYSKLCHDLVTRSIARNAFLGLVREYQRFGLSYKPNQSPSGTLLNDDIWMIPDDWDVLGAPLPYSVPHPSIRAIYERYEKRKVVVRHR